MRITLLLVAAAAATAFAKPLKVLHNTNNHTIGTADFEAKSASVNSTAMTPDISKRGIGDFLNGIIGNLSPACDTSKCRCCIIMIATCWHMPMCTKPPYPGTGNHEDDEEDAPSMTTSVKPPEGTTYTGVICMPRGGGCYRADGSPPGDGF